MSLLNSEATGQKTKNGAAGYFFIPTPQRRDSPKEFFEVKVPRADVRE